ncbi:copper resistance protein NlpE N-terminal domain-containing protein [Sphingomonas sanxanigenens]|uniref:NlpE C-terminal OB domain-containing protein n=1 Tax=Sphingomonas sanxanigenens DSM 19645 = NX02 TaxID=1123269 RepID=W0AJB9_9SPHN|nr:copper resistance protein NlpE N-terminal domain-containing protein [Sphingomonas sanxanigenens]AHE55760.1 hypothetical protein NX02_20595 [Sphingomonas sanxanigenens DSM 19645 = NX02]
MRRLIVASLLLLAACGETSAPSDSAEDSLGAADAAPGDSGNAADAPAPVALQTREPTWFYRDDPGGGLALYGEAGGQGQFAIRCDRRGRRLLLQRAAGGTDAAELTLTVDGSETRYAARARGGGTPRLEAAAALDDDAIDRLLGAGTLAVDATGTQPLQLPVNGTVRRVIESCRAPVRQAAVADGARFQGSLPCADCAGVDLVLSFTARGPETERYRLERRRRDGGTDLTEGSVELIGEGDAQSYQLTPDNGDAPIMMTRGADGALLFPSDTGDGGTVRLTPGS